MKERVILKKGKLILSHISDGWEFPRSIAELIGNNKNIFFKFAFYDNRTQSWREQDQSFKFRVESYEY